MEGNNTAMASSTSAPSAIIVSSMTSNNSLDHSIALETVQNESTIKVAKDIVVLGSNLKQ
eukprot:5674294-Ditylum_brightwellii.AAC.2